MPSRSKTAQYTEEHRKVLKEIFMESELSLFALAKQSESLIGLNIDPEQVKHWSMKDPDGTWEVQRAKNREGTRQADVFNEVLLLRRLIFNDIHAQATGGLFVYDYSDENQVVSVIEEHFPDAKTKTVKPGGISSSLINAYMNLLDKANIQITGGRSGKTSRQQVLELIESLSRSPE